MTAGREEPLRPAWRPEALRLAHVRRPSHGGREHGGRRCAAYRTCAPQPASGASARRRRSRSSHRRCASAP